MDLIKASWLKGLGEKTLATVTRLLCLAFVVLSYLIANYPTPILEMMSYSWGILSGAFWRPTCSPCTGRASTVPGPGRG